MLHQSWSNKEAASVPAYMCVSGGAEYTRINKQLDTTELCLLDRRFFYTDLLDTLKYSDVFHDELLCYLTDFQHNTEYLNHLIKSCKSIKTTGPFDSSLIECLVPHLVKFTQKVQQDFSNIGAYVNGKLPYELYKFDNRALLFRRI
jgi:hypothetical protein